MPQYAPNFPLSELIAWELVKIDFYYDAVIAVAFLPELTDQTTTRAPISHTRPSPRSP